MIDMPDGVIEVILIDNDISKWRVTMQCLEIGNLKSHVITYDIRFPEDYPHSSPIIQFVNQIYHPNIDFKTGQLCTDGKWCVVYDVRILLLTVRSLLAYPNIEEPVNTEAAEIFSSDKNTFNEISSLLVERNAPLEEISLLYVDKVDQSEMLNNIEKMNEINVKKMDDVIHKYAHENNPYALEIFLKYKHIKSEINAINKNGNTGLHIASIFGYSAIVSLLLKFGADTSIINKYGRTPYDCAVHCNNHHIQELLLNADQNAAKRHREHEDSEHDDDNAYNTPLKKSKQKLV